MGPFVGRETELKRLADLLAELRPGSGRALSVRGRRRVGKSRLIAEFLSKVDEPSLYYTAAHGATDWELRRFAAEVSRSTLPNRDIFQSGATWEEALRALALILPNDRPSIVVLDEVPYLMREDKTFEGSLQAVWDRVLSRLPVLLILIGSNRSEMERLGSYDRPFYMRGTEMELGPLTVADTAALTGLEAADAIDAYAVTGGLPQILMEWKRGSTVRSFLTRAVENPLSALIVSGERSLSAEAPPEANARLILEAVGAGETTFSKLAQTVGIAGSSLSKSLDELTDRRLIVVERPLSTAASKNTRYRIDDPYLRFWLTFLADQIPTIEAGRFDVVLKNITKRWSAWRGRAVEPIIRDLLWRSRDLVPEVAVIGSWWNRSNSVELDVVGADRSPVAKSISLVGSIKWRERAAFGISDATALAQARNAVPGAADAAMVAVSRAGFDLSASDLIALTPEQLVFGAKCGPAVRLTPVERTVRLSH